MAIVRGDGGHVCDDHIAIAIDIGINAIARTRIFALCADDLNVARVGDGDGSIASD